MRADSGSIEKSSGLSVSSVVRLAQKVARLAPSHRDPERFHEDKSEIVAELYRFAEEVRRYG